MSDSKGLASPSTIDCICCALGASILLWFATIAVNANQTEGIQSLILVTFEITYTKPKGESVSTLPVDSLVSLVEEEWRLNGQDLVQFKAGGIVDGKWIGWGSVPPGTDGACSFAPTEIDTEVVSFSGSFDPKVNLARRTLLIQNSEKQASGVLSIKWKDGGSIPTRIVVRVIANGAETQTETIENNSIETKYQKGLEVFAKPGQLLPEPI